MENIIEKHKDKLPESYLKFMSEYKEFHGFTDIEELGYISLWNIQELQDAWNTLEIEGYLGPEWFPIGSDGGGEMIVIKLSSTNKELFYIPFIPIKEELAQSFCEDFSTLYDAIKRTESKS